MAKNTSDLIIAITYLWIIRNLKLDNFDFTSFNWANIDVEKIKKYIYIAA